MWLLSWFTRLWRGPVLSPPTAGSVVEDPACAPTPVTVAEPPADPEPPSLLDDAAGWWVPIGTPVVAPPAPDTAAPGADPELLALVEADLASDDLDLPLLPRVAQRALFLLQDEEVDYGELADLIGSDPAIAADVLRVANSTAYARMFRITQLEVAFTRLGRSALRSRILGLTLKGMAIRTGGPVRTLGEELWQRSLAGAVVLSELSADCGLRADEAFLVGLLRDIGDLAILPVLRRCCTRSGRPASRAVFEQLTTKWHEPLGARLAGLWHLPEPLPAVIGDHHRLPAADDELTTYRLLVQLADVICGLMSFGPYVPYDFFQVPCVQRLGITDTADAREWLTRLPATLAEQVGVF